MLACTKYFINFIDFGTSLDTQQLAQPATTGVTTWEFVFDSLAAVLVAMWHIVKSDFYVTITPLNSGTILCSKLKHKKPHITRTNARYMMY